MITRIFSNIKKRIVLVRDWRETNSTLHDEISRFLCYPEASEIRWKIYFGDSDDSCKPLIAKRRCTLSFQTKQYLWSTNIIKQENTYNANLIIKSISKIDNSISRMSIQFVAVHTEPGDTVSVHAKRNTISSTAPITY